MGDNSVSVRVEVDGPTLRKLVVVLKTEADGKSLTRDLVTELKGIGQPALAAVKGSILSMSSKSISEPSLRATVARQTKLSVRTTGRKAGISIYTLKTGMPRGFTNAPKYLNAAKGWRHRVFGSDRWVRQIGKPGWFDDTLRPFREPGKEAARVALDAVAKRVSERAKV